MKKGKPLSPKEWWLCGGEFCANPLAKILKGQIGFPEVVEILGFDGQRFFVHPKYIKLFCIKCGKSNDIIGGDTLSDEWKSNFQRMQDDIGSEDDDENFYTNQYLRNLLIEKLNPAQKAVFQYMQRNPDGEWTMSDLAKELKIEEKSAAEAWGAIIRLQADIKVEEIHKELRQMDEEMKNFKKILADRGSRVDRKL